MRYRRLKTQSTSKRILATTDFLEIRRSTLDQRYVKTGQLLLERVGKNEVFVFRWISSFSVNNRHQAVPKTRYKRRSEPHRNHPQTFETRTCCGRRIKHRRHHKHCSPYKRTKKVGRGCSQMTSTKRSVWRSLPFFEHAHAQVQGGFVKLNGTLGRTHESE